MGRKKLPPGEKRIRKSIYFDPPMMAAIDRWERAYYPNHDVSSIVRVAVQIGLEALAKDPAPLGKPPMRPDVPSMAPSSIQRAADAAPEDEDPSKDVLDKSKDKSKRRDPNTAPPPKGLVVKDDPATREGTPAQFRKNRRNSGSGERR